MSKPLLKESQNLKEFIKMCFYTVNPSMDFIDNWHVTALAEVIEQVTSGKIKRLIITMPPRYMKSLCVSISYPDWLLGVKPYKKIVVASYSMFLAKKFLLEPVFKFIIQSLNR